ncbi:MAG: hypothetical protein WBC71_00380, partial [Salaquimonas sp.]
MRFLLHVTCLAVFWTASLNIGSAQTIPGLSAGSTEPATSQIVLPENLTPETIRELVSKLSDTEVRS